MKTLCLILALILVSAAFPQSAAVDRIDCHKTPETGVCRGLFRRYYYDPLDDQCKEFFYGGCGGNKNKFETEEECYRKCREPDCPPNKEFGSFGDCPPSCLKNPPKFCTLRLNYGCKCKKGYVLTKYKDYESDCIKPEECPD